MVSIAFVFGITDFVVASGLTLADSEHVPTLFQDRQGNMVDVEAFDYFGSVFLGMQMLLATVTGGIDWLPVSNALWDLSFVFLFILLFYICFFNFVILNTMTSLFLDGVMYHTEKDTSTIVRELLTQKTSFMDALREVHRHMCGGGGTTEATLEAFNQHLTDPEMINFARALEVELVDLQVVFDVLSNSGRQSVDLESFVVGCIRLRGSAKSADLISLSIAQKKLAKSCELQFQHLRNLLSSMVAALAASNGEAAGLHLDAPSSSPPPDALAERQDSPEDDIGPRATGGSPCWDPAGVTSVFRPL